MHSRKSVGPNIVSLGLNILAKSYHPEPPEAVCYREKKKYGQISALKSRRLACQTLSKVLDITSATARVA